MKKYISISDVTLAVRYTPKAVADMPLVSIWLLSYALA